MNKTTRNIVTAAVIGALYAVLTMVLAPISYGRTSGYHLRLACNAYSMPVHIVVRKAQ